MILWSADTNMFGYEDFSGLVVAGWEVSSLFRTMCSLFCLLSCHSFNKATDSNKKKKIKMANCRSHKFFHVWLLASLLGKRVKGDSVKHFGLVWFLTVCLLTCTNWIQWQGDTRRYTVYLWLILILVDDSWINEGICPQCSNIKITAALSLPVMTRKLSYTLNTHTHPHIPTDTKDITSDGTKLDIRGYRAFSYS